MRIFVYADDIDLSDKEIDEVSIILDITEDRKGFIIKRHTALSNTRLFPKYCKGASLRHISELKHILLAERKDNA
jgi:hypothetical protein